MLPVLIEGRESYRRGAWADAYESLTLADHGERLGAGDLELLATAAYLTGRAVEFHTIMDRAHHAHLAAADPVRAARCAFWSGLLFLVRGERGPGTGWLSRARRLLGSRDSVEQGYVLLPDAEELLARGDGKSAYATAASAADIAERFGDADLLACARHLQGRALIEQGELRAGLALLDEAMLPVVAGELAPILTGLIYCSVLGVCLRVCAVHRAREWTAGMAAWCDRQPQMAAFTGICRVHRAEVMRLRGDWTDAIGEAGRACQPGPAPASQPSAAAFYQRGEMHRLRGDVAAAEEAYRTASRLGRDPQPGLALLRVAQGRIDAASAAIRRALSGVTDPISRVTLLPAHVEIMVAAGDLAEAGRAAQELQKLAETFDFEVFRAMAAHAGGTVALAEGEFQVALRVLRIAFELWQRNEVPYEVARVRVLIGSTCRALGDHDGAQLEFAAARLSFEELGAVPDSAALAALTAAEGGRRGGDLTDRERQVLRLVAGGKTNKAVAAELALSERTIDRHVSNIFNKLGVSSRAAATAFAYEHKLL